MKLTEAQKLEKLREAYYDPKMGLGSVDKLYRKLRSRVSPERSRNIPQEAASASRASATTET